MHIAINMFISELWKIIKNTDKKNGQIAPVLIHLNSVKYEKNKYLNLSYFLKQTDQRLKSVI